MAVILNRIINGGFETGLSGWISQSVSIVQAPTNEGAFAALLQGGALNPFLIQSVPAGPGETFELMLSMTRDTAGTTPIVSITIAYFSAANSFLGYGLIENVRVPDTAVRFYQFIDGITSPAPAGTARAQIALTRLGATGTAGIFVDQIVMKQVITDASGAVPILFPNVPTSSQQSQENVLLPDFPETVTLLSLNVTTTQPNQRVLLDVTIETIFNPGTEDISISVSYILARDNVRLMDISPNLSLFVTNPDGLINGWAYSFYPNMTFMDVVPNPGTHTYVVIASRVFGHSISALSSLRAINATVFPPGADCVCA